MIWKGTLLVSIWERISTKNTEARGKGDSFVPHLKARRLRAGAGTE